MPARLFSAYGSFCAAHPWEIIVTTLTLTTCMLTIEYQQPTSSRKPLLRDCVGCFNEADYNSADIIVMTLIRCLAVLYTYYQFRNLRKIGSNYILGIAGLFIVFSSFVFTSTVINILHINLSDLKDTLFFFLLLIDLSKTGKLAQFALSGSNQEVKENIATGMSLLGPSITLDTIVEILVIGVGTLSGVHRLETLSYIACLSVLVNYLIFMSFYPACLSLLLELSRTSSNTNNINTNNIKTFLCKSLSEEDYKSNPIIQRVKLIMSAGLMMVHLHSRWPSRTNNIDMINAVEVDDLGSLNQTQEATLQYYIIRWLNLSNDHMVILTLLLALLAKFVIFENKEELQEDIKTQVVKNGVCNSVENVLNGAPPKILEKSLNADLSLSNTINSQQNTMRFYKRQSISKDEINHVPTFTFSLNEDSDDDLKQYEDKGTQTTPLSTNDLIDVIDDTKPATKLRSLEECLNIYKSDLGAAVLTDEEVMLLVKHRHIAAYQIEKAVDNPERGVQIRRKMIGNCGNFTNALQELPYRHYDYSLVMGACCENVIGYVPIPVGYVGPLNLDNNLITVPLATTEGCLVASTNRGSRALLKNGVTSRVVADGMTRGPVIRFPSLDEASLAMGWMETPSNFATIKESFDSSSRFARLMRIHIRIAGRLLFIRFVAQTGDAMGMNMLSKGTELSLKMMQTHFPNMEILSLSGNFCTDKKPAAVNWIEGRGKSVVCEAIVPGDIVSSVLKTSVPALVDVNNAKNMIGSAIAGSIGGFNAHAANLVTALFIATGQDPAQNVGSSNCMTLMEPWGRDGNDLYISCTMPSIEVGTVGGGTVLTPQAACLDMLGIKGSHSTSPGKNANQLARIVCAVVLAGELSLMAALTSGDLVKSHLKHNRSAVSINSSDSSNLKASNCAYLRP